MIDERFGQSQDAFFGSLNYLSGWIRKNMIYFNKFNHFEHALSEYFKTKFNENMPPTQNLSSTINVGTCAKKRKYMISTKFNNPRKTRD
ncbi:hypothetical protein MXB_1152 [Myxobolus squamalis]|nr:hypothetical protein MXB_1152 [Myxobolus squamalis]